MPDRSTCSITDADPTGPLAGCNVVDLTDLRGALCARILADFGADVIRVERGDPPDSFEHAYRNANKRVVALDLEDRDDRVRLDELLARADVLVENLDASARWSQHTPTSCTWR